MRPTIAGERAGEGTLATEGATLGRKDWGIVECIILVDGIGCRVEKSSRGVCGRDTPDDKHLSDRPLQTFQASVGTTLPMCWSRAWFKGIKGRLYVG